MMVNVFKAKFYVVDDDLKGKRVITATTSGDDFPYWFRGNGQLYYVTDLLFVNKKDWELWRDLASEWRNQ